MYENENDYDSDGYEGGVDIFSVLLPQNVSVWGDHVSEVLTVGLCVEDIAWRIDKTWKWWPSTRQKASHPLDPSFSRNVQLPYMPTCNLEMNRRLSDGTQDPSEWRMANDLSRTSDGFEKLLKQSYGAEMCSEICGQSKMNRRDEDAVYGGILRTGLCIWDTERLHNLGLGPPPDRTVQLPTRSELFYVWCSILRDVRKHHPPIL